VQERKVSFLWGILAGIAFGTASIFIRALTLDSHTIAIARLVIASVVLSLFLLAQKKHVEIVFDLPLLIMGIFIALHFLFFISSVKDTTIMAATVLVNTVPIFTMVLGYLFFSTPVKRREIFSVLLCVGGVLIISANDIGRGTIWGDAEALLAAFFEAIYLNIGAKMRKTKDTIPIMIPTYCVATIILLLFWRRIPAANMFDSKTVLLILAVGIIPTAFGHTLYIASLKGLKAFQSATLVLLEPISASLLAFFIFSEVPPLVSMAGSLIIFGGIYVLFSGEKK
jgi:drug/metabolite transporter (DMT)-like permease